MFRFIFNGGFMNCVLFANEDNNLNLNNRCNSIKHGNICHVPNPYPLF